MRIVAATTVTGPYIVARYRRFAETHPQHELILVEFGRVSDEYAWLPSDVGVPYRRFVLSETPVERLGVRQRLRLIRDALDELRPDVLVVCGYGVTGMGAMMEWAATRPDPVPIVMLSETQEVDFQRTALKEWLKRRYIGLCSAALVGGTPHRAYMAKLGMPPSRISIGYDVVDNDYFAHGAELARRSVDVLRKDLGLPEHYFLASARFISKKNLHRLIGAYAGYRRTVAREPSSARAWGLVLLGDGELRGELEALIETLGLFDAVALPGFKQYDELCAFYGLAGAFIHVSTSEQWGLVVNEAMAAGLPVIVSERCGCASDLVEEGHNGFSIDPNDVDALAQLMVRVASDDCDRVSMSKASLQIIARWTPDTFARGLGQAIDAALSAPKPRLGGLDHALLWVLSRR